MKPRYHIIISLVVMAGLALLAYTKRAEVSQIIRWHERMLTWDDFPIISSIEGDYHAMVYSDIQFEGNREDQYLHIYAQMIPHRSGRVVQEDAETEQLLIHEQNHFNITEYHARLFRQEVVEIGRKKLTNDDLKRLGKKYLDQEAVMQITYDKESKHNTEWVNQRYWELYIAGLLRETAYYTNQDLYTYQRFLREDAQWFRKIYNTLEGELLTSYPEKAENTKYGNVYHVDRKPDSTTVKFYDNGKLVNGGYFKSAISIITFPNATTREIKLFDAEGNSFSNNKTAHNTRTVKDSDGNVSISFFDDQGKQITSEGVFTRKGEWNAAEKSMYSSYFDKDNKPVMRDGVYHELRNMGENKITKKISYFDSAGKPMRDNDFVSIYEYETDENFSIKSFKQFDVDGKYVLGLDGYHTIYTHDSRGNIKSEAFLDELGNNTADVDGVHKYTYTYNVYGNLTDLRKFNTREIPTKGIDDFHQYVTLIDTLGRTTFYAKYYPNYVLKFSENKEAATTYEYEEGKIANLKNVDAYGKDEIDASGILVTKQFSDNKNKVIKEEFYGEGNTWAKTEDGVSAYKYKYDERGNKIELAAFDSLGNRHAWQEDVAITRWEYDDQNNRTKTTYFTVDNELANAVENTAYNFYVYNDKSNLLERTNFNKNMKPSAVDGVFRTLCIPNRFGKDSIVKTYDVNHQLLPGGIKKYTYNSRGIILSESYYNIKNQAVNNEFGVHKVVNLIDTFDRYIGVEYYGKNGERVLGADGYFSLQYQLTKTGFVRSFSYYNEKEKPILGPEGFHKVENHYNDMDEIVRTSTYGTDLKLLNNDLGIADFIYQIDSSGRTLRISFYNSDGELTEDTDGIAEYIYTPNMNGLYYLEKQLDSAGNEVEAESI